MSNRAFLCRTGLFCVEPCILLSNRAFLCRTSVIISVNTHIELHNITVATVTTRSSEAYKRACLMFIWSIMKRKRRGCWDLVDRKHPPNTFYSILRVKRSYICMQCICGIRLLGILYILCTGGPRHQNGFRGGRGGGFNIKMSSYQYRKSHCGDKTILRPSYLYNGIPILVRWRLYIESGPWWQQMIEVRWYVSTIYFGFAKPCHNLDCTRGCRT